MESKHLMRRATYIAIFLCCSISVCSQDQDSKSVRRQPYLQLNYHSGSFWSRTEYLQEAFEDPYRALELRFGFQSIGKEFWQQYHKYPKYGFGMHYSDL